MLLALQNAAEQQNILGQSEPIEKSAVPPQQRSIGHYKVAEKLGEGGFGTVYRVLDPAGRVRALKILNPRFASRQADLNRFDREIRILSLLKHPNVVSIHDAGVEDGTPYFIMDYVQGLPLRRLLRNLKRLEPHDAVAITMKLAQVYQYIHTQGVVSGDITPSNIILEAGGTLKVLDFGVARMFAKESESRAGRPIAPRLHDAWLEWEMTPPGKVLSFELDPSTGQLVPRIKEQLRTTFRKLAEKYFGDPSKRDEVKRRITRLHRQLKDH